MENKETTQTATPFMLTSMDELYAAYEALSDQKLATLRYVLSDQQVYNIFASQECYADTIRNLIHISTKPENTLNHKFNACMMLSILELLRQRIWRNKYASIEQERTTTTSESGCEVTETSQW